MHCDDILKVAFEGAIADDNELEVIALIVGHDLMEDVGEELAALLNRVEPGGPEEEGGFVIDVEAEFFLEDDFVQGLTFVVCGGVKILSNSRIGVRVEGGVGRVENPGSVSSFNLGVEIPFHGFRKVAVSAVHHFPQEGGADGGDKVSIGDGGGQKVDPVVVVGLFEGVRIVFVVKGFPKLGGINPPALDLG